MKKWLTALLGGAAALAMSFPAFAAEDPAAVLDRVSAKADTLDSMDSRVGMHIVLLPDEQDVQSGLRMDMDMTMKMDGVVTGDLRYLTEAAVSTLGVTAYSVSFYEDGYVYTDTDGLKLKYPMDLEAVMESASGMDFASELESSYMKNITLSEINGVRVLGYEMDTAQMNALMGEIMGSLAGTQVIPGASAEMAADISFREIRGSYILTDDDYYSYANMYMVYDMKLMDQDLTCIILMEMNVNNPGQEITLTLPSTEGYQELAGYYDAMLADLDVEEQ